MDEGDPVRAVLGLRVEVSQSRGQPNLTWDLWGEWVTGSGYDGGRWKSSCPTLPLAEQELQLIY